MQFIVFPRGPRATFPADRYSFPFLLLSWTFVLDVSRSDLLTREVVGAAVKSVEAFRRKMAGASTSNPAPQSLSEKAPVPTTKAPPYPPGLA